MRDILFVGIGVLLGWLGNYYFYQKDEKKRLAQQELEIARYVVAAMLLRCPVKDSRELNDRINRYIDALRRTKTDKRGTPVFREDGSIGVDFNITLTETIKIDEKLSTSY